jgi:hypothetical protein
MILQLGIYVENKLINNQEIPTSNLPKLGFCFPASILSAVDFPIPFVPTNPKTSPGRGIGSL